MPSQPPTLTELTARSHIHAASASLHVGADRHDLQIIGGSVTVDAGNVYRRTATLTIADPDGALDHLTRPGAAELRLRRGVLTPTGIVDVSLGVFGVSEDEITARDRGRVTMTCTDRARRVARAGLTDFHVVPPGAAYPGEIKRLINSRRPGLAYNFVPDPTVTPLLVFSPGDDPWIKAQDMADSIGCDLFFDRDGVLVLRYVPDPERDPVRAEYTEGENSVILGATRRRSDEESPNRIIIVGQASGGSAPVLAEAVDDDPASATFIGNPYGSSPYGEVPHRVATAYVETLTQAREMAKAELRKRSRLAEQASLDLFVDPSLDAGHVISVLSPSSRLDSRSVVDALTIPLGPEESMPVTLRRRRTR